MERLKFPIKQEITKKCIKIFMDKKCAINIYLEFPSNPKSLILNELSHIKNTPTHSNSNQLLF
jgi:hypothetical protein